MPLHNGNDTTISAAMYPPYVAVRLICLYRNSVYWARYKYILNVSCYSVCHILVISIECGITVVAFINT